MRGIESKAARHPAAARIDDLDVQLGDQSKHIFRRPHRIECFLMAMAVQQCMLFGKVAKHSREPAGWLFPRQEFLDEHGNFR